MNIKRLGKPTYRDGNVLGWVTGSQIIERNLHSGEVRTKSRRNHHRQGRAL